MSFHFAWRLVYNKFSFMFDFASARVSGGRWKLWGRTSLSYVQGRRVIELGHGPGHLLIDLKKAGHQPFGVDLSPGMGRLAARRLRRAGADVPLVRCRAEILPFRASSFDAAVATFPTDHVLQLVTLREVARVVRQGGVLTMVVGAQREGSQPDARFIDWLKSFTGQNGYGADGTPTVFSRAGFRPRIECQSIEGSPVILVVAEKRQRQDGTVNMLPTVDVSSSVRIPGKDQSNKVVTGRATDADEDPLFYRWLKDQTILSDWKAVEEDGSLSLELQNLPPLQTGEYTLSLEVSDPYEKVIHAVALTIENSPPVIIVIREVAQEAGHPIIISAHVSDYDGDLLNYYWLEEGTVLESGSIQSVKQGNPAILTTIIGDLTPGLHMVRLQVSDGINAPVSDSVSITIRQCFSADLSRCE